MLGMAPQFALDPFGLSPVQAGVLMGYVGVAQLTAQAFNGWFQKKVEELEPANLHNLSAAPLAAALSGGAVVVCLLAVAVPCGISSISSAVVGGTAGSLPLPSLASFVFWMGPLAAAQQL